MPAQRNPYPSLFVEVVTIQQIMSLSRRGQGVDHAAYAAYQAYHSEEADALSALHLWSSRLSGAASADQDARDVARHPFIGYIDDMVFTPGLDYMREILPGQQHFIKVPVFMRN